MNNKRKMKKKKNFQINHTMTSRSSCFSKSNTHRPPGDLVKRRAQVLQPQDGTETTLLTEAQLMKAFLAPELHFEKEGCR
jgi:hypothetical protein